MSATILVMKTFLILALCGFGALASIKVAITVDDLPTHAALPPRVTRVDVAKKMLSVLKKHKVNEAYAFINVGKVEQQGEPYEVLKLWQEAGYSFGNHSYLHEDLHTTEAAKFIESIQKNEPMLKKLSLKNNWRYFRYPFLREGDTLQKRNAIREYLKKQGYTIAQVTIDFEDWSWNNPYARCMSKKDLKSVAWLEKTYLHNATDMLERAEKLSNALFKRSIAHILLLHIGAFDAEMLDSLLTLYEARGVEFISLEEAAKDVVYKFDPGVTGKWGSEFTYQVLKAHGLTLKDVGLEPYIHYPEAILEKSCK